MVTVALIATTLSQSCAWLTDCGLQLTQKKTTLQFKALDQTLQTVNRESGQKEALTYRCADMDRIVPSLMGVSKVGCRFTCSSLYRRANCG